MATISLPRRFAAPLFRGPNRVVDLAVIHCAASPNGADFFHGTPGQPDFRTPVQRIDAAHEARGFKRSDKFRAFFNPSLTSIGYHYLIYLDGTVVTGRHLNEIGAHAEGWNAQSVGVCMLGTDAFTLAQWSSLAHIIGGLERQYATGPNGRLWIRGHRDLPDVHKTCPGFSVDDWLAGNRAPLAGHICEVAHG